MLTRLHLVKPSSAISAAPSSSQTLALKKIVATSLNSLSTRSRKLWARSKPVVVEVPGIRQSNAARKRRKKVVEGVAGRAGRDTHQRLCAELRRLGVTQKHSRPNYPTTCGKVERFHQTLKKWLTAETRRNSRLQRRLLDWAR